MPKARGSLDTSVAAASLPPSLRLPTLPANAAKGLVRLPRVPRRPIDVPALAGGPLAVLAREAVGRTGASLPLWLL